MYCFCQLSLLLITIYCLCHPFHCLCHPLGIYDCRMVQLVTSCCLSYKKSEICPLWILTLDCIFFSTILFLIYFCIIVIAKSALAVGFCDLLSIATRIYSSQWSSSENLIETVCSIQILISSGISEFFLLPVFTLFGASPSLLRHLDDWTMDVREA